MNARDFIVRYKRLDCEIEDMILEIEELEAKATSLGVDYSIPRVISGENNGAAFEDAAIEIADKTNALKGKVAEYMRQKEVVEAVITNHEPAEEREVLWCVYVQKLNFEQISAMTGRPVCDLHGMRARAMKKLTEQEVEG